MPRGRCSTTWRKSMPNADIADTATYAAATIAGLSTGNLAELRRMELGNFAPWFWRLATRCPATVGIREEDWMHVVRILAILTPRGDPENGPRLHQPSRHLGAVLCDGGDRGWSETAQAQPRPAYSELRFAKLLESKGAQRSVLLTRAARSLARSMLPGSGVNVIDIAFATLYPESVEVNNGLARSFYARLDGASRRAGNQEEEHK